MAECRSLGYVPSVWIRMVEQHGAVETTRHIIMSGDLQDGLLRLLSLGRIDLTIEQQVLDERWHELFTDQKREVAHWRLEEEQRRR